VLKIAFELFKDWFRYRAEEGLIFIDNNWVNNRVVQEKKNKNIIKTTIILSCNAFALLVILFQFYYLIVIYCVVLFVTASLPIRLFFEQSYNYARYGQIFLIPASIISRFVFSFFFVIHEIFIKSYEEKTILRYIYLFANSRLQLSTALISIVISDPLLVWI
jgi:hypothetical protein